VTQPRPFDIASIVVCTLAWGTTWYAITLQLGQVDLIVSVVYRFSLASALLFAWCALRREPIAINARQHVEALGQGLFTFALQYPLVYAAETRVSSAVVAVVFAAMAFLNLVLFRFVFRDRARASAWIAAGFGVIGVGILSWSEIAHAEIGGRAATGLILAMAAVVIATFGNAFARRSQASGAPIAASTAWAMAYGSLLLSVFALATGRTWSFAWTSSYVLSLLHLALIGSVLAFLLYYGLAQRRGFAAASYISALTPPVAMLVSTLFESKIWPVSALAGVALILAGHWLLMRTKRA